MYHFTHFYSDFIDFLKQYQSACVLDFNIYHSYTLHIFLNMAPSSSRDSIITLANEAIQRYLESRLFLDSIRQAVKEAVQEELNDIVNRIETNEAKILDLECRVDERDKEIAKLKSVIDKQQNAMDAVQRAVNSQEQYSRRNCLRFQGISESDGEDTDAIICQLAKEKLNVSLSKDDIERSHRLSSKKDQDQGQQGNARVTRNNKPREKRPRVIIVKFVSYRIRKLILSRRRDLKGTKIGIEEDLTRSNAELLKKTKECSKVLAAWPSDGRILALIPASGGRTMKRLITRESDLDFI